MSHHSHLEIQLAILSNDRSETCSQSDTCHLVTSNRQDVEILRYRCNLGLIEIVDHHIVAEQLAHCDDIIGVVHLTVSHLANRCKQVTGVLSIAQIFSSVLLRIALHRIVVLASHVQTSFQNIATDIVLLRFRSECRRKEIGEFLEWRKKEQIRSEQKAAQVR